MVTQNKYAIKDEISCMLIDNQTSYEDMKQIFDEILQEKKDGLHDEDYAVK